MENPWVEKIVRLAPWAYYEVLKKTPVVDWEPPKEPEPLGWVVEETLCPYEIAK